MKFYMILMMLMLPSSGHAKCVCPKGWSAYGRHCYLYVSQRELFYNAEAICLSKSLNGRESHLVSVLDDGESDFIAELAEGTATHFWIGLKGYYAYHSWQWIDGEPYLFTNWGATFPSSSYSSDENCILMEVILSLGSQHQSRSPTLQPSTNKDYYKCSLAPRTPPLNGTDYQYL
ncbi:snaclec coagulation factor IX-binding protein subunit A-like [Asterias amurensis]|uniref:snaclec coagulation factor IX-binding protein subunit A-like n=1 Tax=Asterias amurensis TaxID=7602 RepID=UPI003AB74168